jgi:tRNA A-37 threonylcarbamoyl transferase component Bud32
VKFTASGLGVVGHELAAPFSVDLCLDPREDFVSPANTELRFTSVARVLPERRVSGLAEHAGQAVFAKLFYGKHARRYWQRELAGAGRLKNADVCTPAVINKGATADGEGFVVFYEALAEPQNLSDDDQEDMLAAVSILAQLHDAGLVQTDVHIFNFLRSTGQYYAIDADGIRRAHLLRQQFANLAMLLAQRAPTADVEIDEIWAVYSAARGAYVSKMGSAAQLHKLTRQQRKHRVRRYLKKTQRSCTEFVRHKSFKHDFICDREHWAQLQRFMLFPEAMLGEGTPLKLGNSSTVVRVRIDDVSYIVKRYNIKSLSHRIRRWIKKRARLAWCNGHHLSFLKIHTARPLALLETRWGWFTGVSYLVMPDCGERNLGQALSTDANCFERVAAPTVAILKGLQAAGLAHGDLKATNFVLSAEDVVLIDYDAVVKAGNSGDTERFLANWDEQPDLQARWSERLAEARL